MMNEYGIYWKNEHISLVIYNLILRGPEILIKHELNECERTF